MEKYNNKKNTRFSSLVHNLYHIVDIDISSIQKNHSKLGGKHQSVANESKKNHTSNALDQGNEAKKMVIFHCS